MKTKTIFSLMLGLLMLFVSTVPASGAADAAQPVTVSTPAYAVVLVRADDSLNIRSGAGVSYSIIGTFPYDATGIVGTGRSKKVGAAKWLEVQAPSGTTGWVNANYLTEYVAPETFCSDTRVPALIASLGTAVAKKSGKLLSPLVSPAHGMTVRVWLTGRAVTYTPAISKYIFQTRYVVKWGAAPGSGLPTNGAFKDVVVPKLEDVLSSNYQLYCNDPSKAGPVMEPWPAIYTNFNYYTVYRPGTPGVDLDWRAWLVGIEYVNGEPRIVSMIHFIWEP